MIFQYRPGVSLFHRIDPLSKSVWLLCLSVLSLVFRDAWPQILLFVIVALTGRFAAGLSLRDMWRGIRIPFWVGVPYFVMQLLFIPGDTEIWRLGSFILTAETLDYATAISVRLVTLVFVSLLFVATTDPRDIVLAMAQKLRIPYRFAFSVSLALRLLPLMEKEAEQIREAQRMRGMRKAERIRERVAEWKRFVFAVFVNTLRRVQTISEMMEIKGFGAYPDRTYRRDVSIPRSGVAIAVGSGGLTLIMLIAYI